MGLAAGTHIVTKQGEVEKQLKQEGMGFRSILRCAPGALRYRGTVAERLDESMDHLDSVVCFDLMLRRAKRYFSRQSKDLFLVWMIAHAAIVARGSWLLIQTCRKKKQRSNCVLTAEGVQKQADKHQCRLRFS